MEILIKKATEVKEKEDTEARKVEEEKRQNELEEARKVAEVQEKEVTEARNVEEEKRQNKLEEARKAAELQEKEQQAHLDADEAIRKDDEKNRQEDDDNIKKRGRGCPWKGEKKEETDSKQGDSKGSEGFFTPVGA